MKSFIVLALFVAVAVAAPQGADRDAQTQEYKADNIGTPEGYAISYKTSNGIQAAEQGSIQDLGTENEGLEVTGQYSYTGPDGVVYTVTYRAGRNGFEPLGAHIPQAV